MNASAGSQYFPGSDQAFNPINPWGRKAVARKADGSDMPDGWKNPLAEEVWQLYVEDHEKGRIPIAPSAPLPLVSEWMSLLTIAIKSGKISGWSNPHLVKVPRQRAVARVF